MDSPTDQTPDQAPGTLDDLIDFLDSSPSPWHAASSTVA
jgi:hypothetical protein